jgi:hypothetical protein
MVQLRAQRAAPAGPRVKNTVSAALMIAILVIFAIGLTLAQ